MLVPPPRERDLETHPTLTTVIARRWSVRAFDPIRPVTASDVDVLVDAARTAPSAYNLQPWRLWIAARGTEDFGVVVESLADYNQVWAKQAALLIVGIAQHHGPEGDDRPWADYDLGQATALLTVEATARGLGVCQMAGLDHVRLAELAGCAPGERVAIVSAVGHPGNEKDLDPAARALQERGRTRRSRRHAAHMTLPHRS